MRENTRRYKSPSRLKESLFGNVNGEEKKEQMMKGSNLYLCFTSEFTVSFNYIIHGDMVYIMPTLQMRMWKFMECKPLEQDGSVTHLSL